MTRRGFIKGLLGAILAGLFVSLYAFFIEPALRLRVTRWQIKRPGWTAPPLRIVVLSDIYLGEPIVTMRRLKQVVRRANAIGGDVIVLLGDYTTSHPFVTKRVPFDEAAQELAKLTAPQGVFSVLGNHDWWDDPVAQRRRSGPNKHAEALKAAGLDVLSNEVRALPGGVWIAGLGDQLAFKPTWSGLGWQGEDDLPGTLAQLPSDGPVILLAHEPDIFPKVPNRVDVTLSGHTHGGQIRFFGWSPRVPSRYGNRFAYGHVHESGRDLVVSGGIGCSILPVRFGVVPEITVVEVSGA